MLLYIIRHAWAEEPDPTVWPDDAGRPLTDEGRKRFARQVKALAQNGFAPDVVVTSPLVRCRQTAEIVVKQVDGKPRLIERLELVPGSNLAGLLDWTIHDLADQESVAWVGHAPDVGDMTAALIGDGSVAIRFAKGAIAAIDFPGPPRCQQGDLRWFVTAKILGL